MRWWLLPLAVAIPLSQARLDSLTGPSEAQREVLYLTSGDAVRWVCPGFEDLAADFYWLRTVQHYGGTKAFAKEKRYELLQPLLNVTTSLDPRFRIAYTYGATFLAERPPLGAGDPEAAMALLKRGVRELPHDWRLRMRLGYYTFLYLDDAQEAARVLIEAAEIPGAAYWLRNLAAMLLARGGQRQVSRQIWTQILESTEEDQVRAVARLNLRRLDALDVATALERLVQAFAARRGGNPTSLDELSVAGLVPAVPTDSSGVPFDYDPVSGRVVIARASELWEAP